MQEQETFGIPSSSVRKGQGKWYIRILASIQALRMNRTIRTVLLLIFGMVIGAGGSEGFHILRDSHLQNAFQQKLRCKQLAESYVKSNSDGTTTVYLERSGFSTHRNSCVAATSRIFMSDSWDYEVVDVITGDTLYSGNCFRNKTSDSLWCGNGRDVQLLEERNKAFDEVVR